jgi:hypothetical protein
MDTDPVFLYLHCFEQWAFVSDALFAIGFRKCIIRQAQSNVLFIPWVNIMDVIHQVMNNYHTRIGNGKTLCLCFPQQGR